MRNAKDGDPRLSFGRVIHALDVQRLTLEPGAEARRCDQIIQLHGQRTALGLRAEGVDVHDSDLPKRGLLNVTHEIFEREILSFFPAMADDVGEQNMLRRLHRIRIDTHQPQHGRYRALDAIPEDFRILHHTIRRAVQRAKNGHRQTRIAAGRVDGHVHRLAQFFDPVRTLAPVSQPFLPQLGLRLGILIDRDIFSPRIIRVDPRLERLGSQIGKSQQRIADVSFGIDGNQRHAIHRRLLKQCQAQTRFTRTRHTKHDAVSHQVLGIIKDQIILQRFGLQIVSASEVKGAQFFVLFR